jgi:hypothetical protein
MGNYLIGHLSNHDGSNVVDIFSKINNHDATNKHNINGETWPQAIVPTYFKKKNQN